MRTLTMAQIPPTDARRDVSVIRPVNGEEFAVGTVEGW